MDSPSPPGRSTHARLTHLLLQNMDGDYKGKGKGKGKGKRSSSRGAAAGPSTPSSSRMEEGSSSSQASKAIVLDDEPTPSPPQENTPLSSHTCPICFYPPRYAVLTPCGHILCGECLFEAVSTSQARQLGPRPEAQCPVCRATLEGWDGKGGGVIGLEIRQVISL